jgi:hypothetical protein
VTHKAMGMTVTLIGKPSRSLIISNGYKSYGPWRQDLHLTYDSNDRRDFFMLPMPYLGEGRIEYVKRVREELAVGLAEAKVMCDAVALEIGEPWVVSSVVELPARERVVEKVVPVLPHQMTTALSEKIASMMESIQVLTDQVGAITEFLPSTDFDTREDMSASGRLIEAMSKLVEARWMLYDANYALGQGELFKEVQSSGSLPQAFDPEIDYRDENGEVDF